MNASGTSDQTFIPRILGPKQVKFHEIFFINSLRYILSRELDLAGVGVRVKKNNLLFSGKKIYAAGFYVDKLAASAAIKGLKIRDEDDVVCRARLSFTLVAALIVTYAVLVSRCASLSRGNLPRVLF